MRILRLTIRGYWGAMIKAGVKREEYREIKTYYLSRLCNKHPGALGGDYMDPHKAIAYTFKEFDIVEARIGYSTHSPVVKWETHKIRIGLPNPEWCPPDTDLTKPVFIIPVSRVL